MNTLKCCTRAVLVGFPLVSSLALGNQADSQGFIEDSHLDLFARTLYFNRDWHNNGAANSYSDDFGQGITAKFTSGFTQGTVGFGIDALSLTGIKFDSSRGHNAAASYPKDSDGRTEDSFSKGGAAAKVRVSNTVFKYGTQFLSLPVLATDTGRLLPETARGLLVTSNEIEGLELNVAHITALSSQFQSGADSKNLKSADAVGGTYAFTDNFSASLYFSDIEDHFKKKYANLNLSQPLADGQSLNLDFNIYRSESQGQELSDYVDNTIWSLTAGYSLGAHSFLVGYQRNSGDTGYVYGADGGAVYNFGNSVQYSDFNAKDETSWQARYDLDFAAYGIPGLTFMVRYLRGDNIDNGVTTNGKEWERNESLRYVIQSGKAKGLAFQVRHAKNVSAALDSDLDETRLIVDYPLSIF